MSSTLGVVGAGPQSSLGKKQAGLDEGVICNGWEKSMPVMAEKKSCRWINS